MRIASFIFAILLSGSFGKGERVHHFSSIVYGQILPGPNASTYETIFTVTAKQSTPASVDLFNEKGQPMQASFVDESGAETSIDSTLRFVLVAGQPLRIKLRLPSPDSKEDVAVETGWANFRSLEDLDVWAQVRVAKLDGTLIETVIFFPERAPIGD